MQNVLSVKGLVKKYPTFELKNINFEIPEGCIVGFIGGNGHGKTTTIRTILGLAKKDAGTVEIFEKDFEQHEKEIRDRMGVVFDETYLYENLTMKQMKDLVKGAYSKWDDSVYHDYMKRFELDEKQKIGKLSKGMKMKYSLALALSHHAELLIMDEPTSALDPYVRKEILDILREYMEEEGKCVFYSTHITSDLDKIADMIVFIEKGEILFVEDKDVLLDKYKKVKGDVCHLDERLKGLFLSLTITQFGFEGVTENESILKENIPNLVVEKVNIEDIMIAQIERKKCYD